MERSGRGRLLERRLHAEESGVEFRAEALNDRDDRHRDAGCGPFDGSFDHFVMFEEFVAVIQSMGVTLVKIRCRSCITTAEGLVEFYDVHLRVVRCVSANLRFKY